MRYGLPNDPADDLALSNAWLTLGLVLVHRQTAAERDRGQQLLAEVSDVYLRRGHNLGELAIVNVYLARERARRGDRDDAIPLMRAAVDHLFREGQLLGWGIPVTCVLVETLLDRGDESDVAEAEAAIERFAAAPADEGLVIRDIWLLRLRALLARAHGDDDRLSRLPGPLPRHGENAWLRGAYRVGRGDAMTAVGGLPTLSRIRPHMRRSSDTDARRCFPRSIRLRSLSRNATSEKERVNPM